MKIIKHSDIESLEISPLQYMQWVNSMLLTLYNSIVPPKISITLPKGGFSNTMPCYIPDVNAMGVKVVNRYVDNSPALDASILLFNSTNGELKSLMDGSMITAMRTGAVAATSILKLKNKKDVNLMGIIGLGVTARATLLCVLDSTPDEKFKIKLLRYKEQAEDFIERFNKYENVEFEIVESTKDVITDSDIVLSCVTYTGELIGEDEWFKEGVLVVPVHTRGFQNCDLFFDKVYGDLTSQISHFGNFDKFKYYNEFAQVLQGKDKGRECEKERILAYNIGIALHDIYIGNEIYNLIDISDNETIDIEFKEKLSKFYI